ncbi:chaperone modulator CbpM [Psychroflexus tropicus]|uniref:chaperone modulator CbpM n=1 Tax=Psychroflexus tropicus TaxID=197345 RepID=UPI000367B2F6|nr:chaperone modulator CbpM [Psychroflexus tropicus]
MESNQLISIKQFCNHNEVPLRFISALKDFDLIEIVIEDEDEYIYTQHLHIVEKMIRLHYDLNINLEGIDAIYHLLKKVEELQKENQVLKNKLRTYESF